MNSKGIGRPGIKYEQFVTVWERLIAEGRARLNTVCDELGGSKSTLAKFREQYERDSAAKDLTIIKQIEITDTIRHAIGKIKIKEITVLQKAKEKLESRIDEYVQMVAKAEHRTSELATQLEDLQVTLDLEKLKFERLLAASNAHLEGAQKREKKALEENVALSARCNQASQQAAVANKEVELLREQLTKQKRSRS